MLTEEMRILAGLQKSISKENPIPKLIKEEQERIEKEKQRKANEQKTVLTHFNIFEEKMKRYFEMFSKIMTLFDKENKKEFIDGLLETKYPVLQEFADIVINENIISIMKYIEKNYYRLKEELDKIEYLIEKDLEENSKDYFVTNAIISKDKKHNFFIRLYKRKDLEDLIFNEIPYGSQIISIGKNLAIVKIAGKKYYTPLTPEQLSELEMKGFLI